MWLMPYQQWLLHAPWWCTPISESSILLLLILNLGAAWTSSWRFGPSQPRQPLSVHQLTLCGEPLQRIFWNRLYSPRLVPWLCPLRNITQQDPAMHINEWLIIWMLFLVQIKSSWQDIFTGCTTLIKRVNWLVNSYEFWDVTWSPKTYRYGNHRLQAASHCNVLPHFFKMQNSSVRSLS